MKGVLLTLVSAAHVLFVAEGFAPAPFAPLKQSLSSSAFAPPTANAAAQHASIGSRSSKARHHSALRMAADFYQTLGISKGADTKEIKSAYRKMARKYHPDVNPTGEAQFKEISRAYEVLSDPETRQRYDQFGEAGLRGSGMGGGAGGSGQYEVDLSDFFDMFSGGGRGGGGRGRQQQRRGPVKGDDLRVDLDLSFKTACFGGEEQVQIRHLETCSTCTGSGAKPGAKVSTCSQCGGQGVVIQVQRTPLGAFQTQVACPGCRGTGQKVEAYCNTCSGQGLIETTKQVKVRIPAGVDTGNKLRVKGEGDAAKGAPSGDLYVFITSKKHPTFERKGADIYADKPVPYLDAILGNDSVRVEVVDGEVEIKVPAGTQPGTVLRIRNKGAPILGSKEGARGDHYVTIKVQMPKELTDDERNLLEKLRTLRATSKEKKKAKIGFGLFNK